MTCGAVTCDARYPNHGWPGRLDRRVATPASPCDDRARSVQATYWESAWDICHTCAVAALLAVQRVWLLFSYSYV